MRFIKAMILLGAVLSIAGMAFFQFFVLLACLPLGSKFINGTPWGKTTSSFD